MQKKVLDKIHPKNRNKSQVDRSEDKNRNFKRIKQKRFSIVVLTNATTPATVAAAATSIRSNILMKSALTAWLGMTIKKHTHTFISTITTLFINH